MAHDRNHPKGNYYKSAVSTLPTKTDLPSLHFRSLRTMSVYIDIVAIAEKQYTARQSKAKLVRPMFKSPFVNNLSIFVYISWHRSLTPAVEPNQGFRIWLINYNSSNDLDLLKKKTVFIFCERAWREIFLFPAIWLAVEENITKWPWSNIRRYLTTVSLWYFFRKWIQFVATSIYDFYSM